MYAATGLGCKVKVGVIVLDKENSANAGQHENQTRMLTHKQKKPTIALILLVILLVTAFIAAIFGYYLIAALIVWVTFGAIACLFVLGASKLSKRDP